MDKKIGEMKYGIANISKKDFWKDLKKQMKLIGFKDRTDSSIIKETEETFVLIQLQTSQYDNVDYYINIACIVKALNPKANPLFDRDRMNFVRIEDKGTLEACLEDINYYVDSFSSIEKLKNITANNPSLYNSSTYRLLNFLGI